MSNDAQSVKAALRKALGVEDKEVLDIILCNVDSVDIQNWTCNATPNTGNNSLLNTDGTLSTAQITDIQLTAQKGSNGAIPIPALNSQVTVLVTVRLDSYVVQWSDLQGWVVFIDNGAGGYTKILIGIDAPGQSSGVSIQFNDGSYGGLVEVVNLVTKINNLENLLNDLIGKYNSHTHVVPAAPGTSNVPIPLETSTITPITARGDIENTVITHGK